MTARIEGDYLVFSTGRRVLAHAGVLGIDAELKTFHGYDGEIGEFEDELTERERLELAELVIRRWRHYARLRDETPRPSREAIERAVIGGLKSAIHDHGPVTLDQLTSATKRIVGQLRISGIEVPE